MGNTSLRRRGLDVEFMRKQGLLYGLMTSILAGGYVLLISGFTLAFSGVLENDNPYLIGMAVFFLAIASFPLHSSLRDMVDGLFLRKKETYQEWLVEFGRELSQSVAEQEVIELLRKQIARALSPSILLVFICRDDGNFYLAGSNDSGRTATDLQVSAESALAQLLSNTQAPLDLDDYNLLGGLTLEYAQLRSLDIQLLVPLVCEKRLIGFLALGKSTPGKIYTRQDLDYLEMLSNQSALALGRSKAVAVLEERLQQLENLAQLAAELSSTLTFAEMLEKTYERSNRLFLATDVWITLLDERTQIFKEVFSIENGKRPLLADQQAADGRASLALEVVKTGKACQRKGTFTEKDAQVIGSLPAGMHVWMGAPLLSGGQPIGAICLGRREPMIAFTSDQLNQLQAVADLLAGAIVKMRLLEESRRRARQLASLNEVARSLTSTLEVDPLLQNMLQHATEILDCEAGSLLMVDESTDELVFTLALGPVGEDLIGHRLPPGAGLAGKAVVTRQAIIQNDARRSEDWFDTDRQTGYETKNVLVVPLKVNDRVLGVLEVLNKRDGAPFNQDDQELLSAYAGQAAIALENARLYTQTDQALAARVKELSTLQRIDRELNASLDLEHVMGLALDWSIAHSQADAGLIGLVQEGELLVMASQGYHLEEIANDASFLKGELPFVSEAINHGYFQRVEFKDPIEKPEFQPRERRLLDTNQGRAAGTRRGRLLPDADAQMAVPVKRQDQVLGVIVLEKCQGSFTEEDCNLLARLSDHAAIAISNAQLYAAVENANLAKSQFVSAAAHELKNPLTSIKGYSDLLAGGAVGPVNEQQARFLATIRANADRMSTLVSDLQDISRIEAGQLQLKFSAVSIEEAVGEAVRTLRKQIEEKNQSLRLSVSPELPKVWADGTRLIQIVTNLLSNAIKYTPPGGDISINAEVSREKGCARKSRRAIHLSVVDSGIGINPEDQKKIFQQFFRSEDPRVREAAGTGLGLSIARRLVELQGGQIWFESAPEKGTAFHFTIPVAEGR